MKILAILNTNAEAAFLYIIFVCFIVFSLFWGQLDLFVFTASRDNKPVLYWITLIFFSVIAVYIGKIIFQ
jgi:hypothetical protein